MEETATKPAILIIEDDHVLQDMSQEAFSNAGFTVIQAFDGEQAIELFKQHPEIRLLLVDIMLPKLSGFEVIKEIQPLILHRQVPIIVFSALSDDGEKTGPESGVTVYISKGDTPLKDVVSMAKEYLDT